MDFLIKNKTVREYLRNNFSPTEWKKAVRYTLIIGIQTLEHIYGDTMNDAHSKLSLQILASLIVSNSAPLQIQHDLPHLSKYLKDIKSQLSHIEHELDKGECKANNKNDKNDKNEIKIELSNDNSHNNHNSHNQDNREDNESECDSECDSECENINEDGKHAPQSELKSNRKNENEQTVYKGYSVNTRNFVTQLNQGNGNYSNNNTNTNNNNNNNSTNDNGIYPQWWPISEKNENVTNKRQVKSIRSKNMPTIYDEAIAFDVPKSNFEASKDGSNENELKTKKKSLLKSISKDGNVIQVHVNLYPEYLKESVDINKHLHNLNDKKKKKAISKNNEYKVNEISSHGYQASTISSLSHNADKEKVNRKNILRRSQEQLQPCQKYCGSESRSRSARGKSRKKSGKNDNNGTANRKIGKNRKKDSRRSLRNVESKIKQEILKDKKRYEMMKDKKRDILINVAKYGNDDENDYSQYYDDLYKANETNVTNVTNVAKIGNGTNAAQLASELLQSGSVINAMNSDIQENKKLSKNDVGLDTLSQRFSDSMRFTRDSLFDKTENENENGTQKQKRQENEINNENFLSIDTDSTHLTSPRQTALDTMDVAISHLRAWVKEFDDMNE